MDTLIKPVHNIRHVIEKTGPYSNISKNERIKKLILFLYKTLPNKHKKILGHTIYLKKDPIFIYVSNQININSGDILYGKIN